MGLMQHMSRHCPKMLLLSLCRALHDADSIADSISG